MLLFNNGPHPDTNYFDCLWCSNNLSSKMGHSRLLFLYFCLFNKIDRKQMFHKILMMDDWSRTADLWGRKRPLYQLCHNHCPSKQFSQNKKLETPVELDIRDHHHAFLCLYDKNDIIHQLSIFVFFYKNGPTTASSLFIFAFSKTH